MNDINSQSNKMSLKLVLFFSFGALCFTLISGQCFYETKTSTSASHCDTSDWDSKLAERKCAPIFDKTNTCCPVSFFCPSDSKLLALEKGKLNSDIKCQFGEWVLEEGDHFLVNYKLKNVNGRKLNAKCSCIQGPYLKCDEV